MLLLELQYLRVLEILGSQLATVILLLGKITVPWAVVVIKWSASDDPSSKPAEANSCYGKIFV